MAAAVLTAATAVTCDADFCTVCGDEVIALGTVVVDSATYTVVVVVLAGSPATVVVVVVGIGTVVEGGGRVVDVVWPGIVVGGSVVGTVVSGTVVVVERGTVVVVVDVDVEVDVEVVVEAVVVVVVVVVCTPNFGYARMIHPEGLAESVGSWL